MTPICVTITLLCNVWPCSKSNYYITTVEIFYVLCHTYILLEILETTVLLNILYQRCNRICEVNRGYKSNNEILFPSSHSVIILI